jgi:predicted Zn-dependent protease
MSGPLGPDLIRSVAGAALELPGVDGVEVLFVHEWGGLTRFAKSSIHQSTSREDTGITVRVISEGRAGVASTNDFSAEGARAAAADAKEMALVSSSDPDFPGLAPAADTPAKEGAYDDATASASPESRAESVATLVAQLRDGFHAAGAYETVAAEVAVANTEGQFCIAAYTQAAVTSVVSGGEDGAGFGERIAGRAEDIDFEAVGQRAMAKAFNSQNPVPLAPGRQTVVLEPAASSTLSEFLSYLGFGGRALAEGRSCFSGQVGSQVAAPSISIYDDALSPASLGIPFDFEGTPKQRVALVQDGIFRGAVEDRRSAKQAGGTSTGHALPPPNPDGPFPLNICVDPGNASLQDMIAAVERGLLITRFHYTNVVNPMEATITGMTRDGTFLIENGELSRPVRNLRFTQSIPEALKATRLVGRDRELASEFFFSASLVPALLIDEFQFTSASDH